MKSHHTLILIFVLAGFPFTLCAGEIKASYLYTLSDFNGAIPCNWVNLAVDREKRETYVVDPGERMVRVFNDTGMEVYRFGDDLFGNIAGLAVAESGDLYILSRLGSSFTVYRCNYRGEPQAKLVLDGLSPEPAGAFVPDLIVARHKRLYLLDRGAMKLVVTDLNGVVETRYDLGDLLRYNEKMRKDSGIVGFDVNGAGEMLFTVPVNFGAFVVSPDKKVRSFGVRGSSPGKFNIVSGIVADENGNIYVADTLRCVVMVFDKEFTFKTEFGYRGFEPGNLIAPAELAVDNGKVYVSQSRARGVSVYRIATE